MEFGSFPRRRIDKAGWFRDDRDTAGERPTRSPEDERHRVEAALGEEATLRDSQQFSASAIPSSEGQRRVNLQTIPTDQNTEIIKKALLEWLSAIKAAVAIAANKIANGTGGKPLNHWAYTTTRW